MNLYNSYAFMLEVKKDSSPGNIAEMYEKYINGKEDAWKGLDWQQLEILKSWASGWAVNEKNKA